MSPLEEAADALRDAAEQLTMARQCDWADAVRENDGELRACAAEFAVAIIRCSRADPQTEAETEAGIEYAIMMLDAYAKGARLNALSQGDDINRPQRGNRQ